MTVGSRQVQLMEVHRIQSLSLRIAVMSLVVHGMGREQLIAVIQSDLDISDSSIGINGQDLAVVAESPQSGLSTKQRATCYVLYLLGSLLFIGKSGINVPGKLWPLVKNAFRVNAKELFGYWSLLEAWIYLYFPMFAPPVRPGARLCKSHIQSILAIPSSPCTNDYMHWFLLRTHPRIQNLDRLPRGVQLPTTAPITPHVLLDMISRELYRDDIDDTTKVGRASDMIKRYHQTRR
ncbi:hypothetical protein M9H77_08092 [Catharanthus roseus]|uniref:Uncharacterized protein n=1 Tax=Catharanthus roseus TaxID=4058 RepID=A0ACC0BX16_CATRO|nr:hypothetical protein M9H77_08092 [Catharanthus roseus]